MDRSMPSFRSSPWGIQTIGTADFSPLKDHHTWQGTDAPLQYLDFDAVEVSRVCYSGGWCLEKHIVSTVMPGAESCSIVSKPCRHEITRLSSMCFFWIGHRRLGWFNSPTEAGFLTPGGQGRAQVPDQPPETVGTFILVSGKAVHSMGSEIRPPEIVNWLHRLPAVWPWIRQSLCASVSSIKSG